MQTLGNRDEDQYNLESSKLELSWIGNCEIESSCHGRLPGKLPHPLSSPCKPQGVTGPSDVWRPFSQSVES